MDMNKLFSHLLLISCLLSPLVINGQNLPIQAGRKIVTVSAADFAPKITEAARLATTGAVTQTERFILPGFDLSNPRNLTSTLGNSHHKELLCTHTTYNKNNDQAAELLRQIQAKALFPHVKTSNKPLLDQLRTFVKDPYLLSSLETSLSGNNYTSAMRDLANFYGLDSPLTPHLSRLSATATPGENVFVNTVLDYITQHPHKVSLPLREVLKDPKVAPFKVIVENFIHRSDALTKQNKQYFAELLRDIYRIHNHALNQAYQSPEVKITVSYYNKALTELQDFVIKNRRSPRWDGPSAEKHLYNQLTVITHTNPFNLFVEALQPLHEIKSILQKYPAVTMTWEETLQQVEAFIQKHGFYPRSFDKTNGQTTEKELKLLDHVNHYVSQNPLRIQTIQELRAKYNLPS